MRGNRRMLRWAIPAILVAVAAVAVAASVSRSGEEGGNDGRSAGTAGAATPTSTTLPGVPDDDPAIVVDAFLDAWAQQDWPALEATIGRGSDLAAAQHQAWFSDLDVTSLDLERDAVTIEAGRAVGSYIVEVGLGQAGRWRYRAEVDLVAQEGRWRIGWAPSALHPSLRTGDHLDVVVRWPQRALITDVAGRALVADEPEIVVGVIPGRVASRPELAGALEEHLDFAPASLDALLDAPGVQPDWYLPVARVDRVTYVAVRPALYPVPGVAFRVETSRTRPYGSLATELIGTTGEATAELLEFLGPPYEAGAVVGRSGIELAFETVLAGKPTYDVVRRSVSDDDVVVHGFPGASGDDVVASLELETQQAAEAIVGEAELPTAVVAIDVATGEIRAAASSPGGGFNEALSGLYPPGSTFKIVVATALLEAGYQRDDVVECPETVTVSGKEFRNADRLPETLTFEQAFARSCNTAFIRLGTSLDAADLLDVAQRFGFDVDYTVGIPSAGARFEPSGDPVEYAAAMIGQGDVLASPLHMASVAATVAAGEWKVPAVTASGPADPVSSFDTGVMADLRAMMRAVVAGGTGRAASIEERDVAGKTGTAEVGEGDDADTIAWFVGFTDDLAFAVMVDGGSSGGRAAAPLARDFLLSVDEPVITPDTTVACVPAGADWPTFQGLGTRTGCSDAVGIEQPRVAWTADVGTQAWLNSPVVVGDTVVVGSAGSIRAGPDGDDGVYALRLGDGSLRWRFTAANDVNGVAVGSGVVVVAGDEGAVWGLDLEEGVELWRVDTDANVFGNPVIVGDLAVVGDAGGTLWGIGLDGTLRWQAQLDGAIRGGPASDGAVVYAVGDLGEVGAFSLDGFELWRERIVFETNRGSLLTVVYAPPTIVEDLLVLTFTVEGGPGSPGVVAYDRYVGDLRWWGSDPDAVGGARWANVRSSVAVLDEGLVLASSISGGVQLADVDTGRARWAADSGIECGRQWASPVVMGEVILLPRPDGALYGFAASDGGLRWRLSLPSALETISDCAGTDDVRLADGMDLQASVAIAPNGMVIVASTGTEIFAVTEG